MKNGFNTALSQAHVLGKIHNFMNKKVILINTVNSKLDKGEYVMKVFRRTGVTLLGASLMLATITIS